MKKRSWIWVFALVLAWPLTGLDQARAERSLADILKEKGVITGEEAQEAQKASPEKKLPKWIETWQFSGDVRLRYQGEDTEGSTTRHRGRIRFRVGAKANVTDTIEAGFRLAGGSDDPRSTNQTFDSTFSTKNIGLDRAYVKWQPTKAVALIGGKMGIPFWNASDLLWDTDINPEGAAAKFTLGPVFINVSGFILDEISKTSDDPLMGVLQVGAKFKADPIDFTVAGTGYAFKNITKVNLEHSANTNTRSEDGTYEYDYNSISGGAEVGFNFGGPVERLAVFGEVIHNPDPDDENLGYVAGVKFGSKSFKKLGDWRLVYMYRYLEKDAWLDVFPDSDFFGGKTGIKGHEFIATLGLTQNTTLGFDYYFAKSIEDSDMDQHLWQLDLIFKF